MVLLTLLGVRNELLVTNVTSCVPLDPGIGWSAVCAYGVFVLVVFVLGVRMVYNDKRLSVPVVFLLIMLCFASLRVSYFVLKILPEYCLRSAASFALNRMCFCFYFTALTLVLFYWAEQAHRTIIDDTFQFLPGIKRWFITLVGIVWIYQLVVLFVWAAGEQNREGDLLYDSNILVDECIAFVLASFFFVYGVRLFVMMRRESEGLDARSSLEARLYLAGAIVMLFFFLARVVVFVWRFVFSYPLPEVIFYLFGYLLPELLPAAMHTYVMRQRKRAGSEGKKFIDDLYAQQNSEEIASFLLRSESTAEDSFVRRDLASPAAGARLPAGSGAGSVLSSPILPSLRAAPGLDITHDRSDFEET